VPRREILCRDNRVSGPLQDPVDFGQASIYIDQMLYNLIRNYDIEGIINEWQRSIYVTNDNLQSSLLGLFSGNLTDLDSSDLFGANFLIPFCGLIASSAPHVQYPSIFRGLEKRQYVIVVQLPTLFG
jgi:hypothetical protein